MAIMGRRCADAIEAVEYLQSRIIGERDQEPFQKYVKDLQLIHDRKKNGLCVPILPGHDQEAWFARLDSNGIWERVFEFLSSPTDVTSAYFACETFRKHLEDKRKLMMLPKVFEVLRGSEYLQYWDFRCARMRISNVMKIQSPEVLKLRLVSKSWKRASEDAFLVPVDASEIQEVCHWHVWDWHNNPMVMVCRLQNVGDIEKASKMLQNSSSCGPILRMMLVDDEKCGDRKNFYSKLVQFLDFLGEAVWGFCFSQRGLGASKDFDYEELVNIVAKLPSLKALRVEAYWEGDDFGEHSRGRSEFNDAHDRLRSLIARKPFPGVAGLVSLSFQSNPAQYECLIGEILQKSPNVEAVFFSEWDHFDHTNAIPDFVWNALGNLTLKRFTFMYSDTLGSLCIQDFLRLGQFDWPLKILGVHMIRHEADIQLDASNIFAVLSKFNDTLEEFKFYTAGIRFVNDRRNVVVDFPKLKEFNIEDYSN